MANKIVVDNLLAGGSYSIYGGNARNDPTSNIVIEDNEFGRLYYPKSGRYGPVTYFDLGQTGTSGRRTSGRGTSGRGPAARKGSVPPGSRRSGAQPGGAASG